MPTYYSSINYLRILLILLLVVCHSFAPFTHAWELPTGISEYYPYKVIGTFSYSFMLPMFVFISGFLFAGSREGYVGMKGYRTLIYRKGRRLLIPSILFSGLYLLCFLPLPTSPFYFVYDLLNGVGHLWFLPMLFWCFLFAWSLTEVGFSDAVNLLLIVILYFLFSQSLPFQLHSSLYYLIYFYIGMIVRKREYTLRPYYRLSIFLLLLLIYIPSVVLLTPVRTFLLSTSYGFAPIAVYGINLLIALSGIASTYLLIQWLLQRHLLHDSPLVHRLGGYCFGVYLFHQFILWALYYHTSFPEYIGTALCPIIAFLLTLPFSLLLTHLFLRYKIGRWIIG